MINILEYLESTIERLPSVDKPAFVGDEGFLTFQQLFDKSRSAGTFLCQQGIYKKPIVVFMEKRPEMIAAFLGVVYSGSYYVPIDAEMPVFRIRLILEAVDPPLVICDDTTSKLMDEWGLNYPKENFNLMCDCPIHNESLATIRTRAVDVDPVYVVFTSGSTGLPKGVIACHRSIIDYVDNLAKVLDVDANTVFGNQSPFYLDACLKEVYNTLKFGATTYIVPKSLFMFPVKLIEYVNEKKINTICWVASALSLVAGLGALDVDVPSTLHTIAFGSEVFPIKHFNRWREVLPDARFIHLYGPTEATGMSAYYEVRRTFEPDEAIPIGQPFPNTDIILLDDNGKEPPLGEPGEICIRGAGLSPGYYGDLEKTKAAFVQNPLSAFPDLIYRTGDIGYRGTCGELFFISRRDHQIKHMGHRIELAEIEMAAARCNGVQMACVVFDKDASKIILYCMPDIPKAGVMAELKANLPRFMVPNAIFPMENLPMTPGGKLDRTALLQRYKDSRAKPK